MYDYITEDGTCYYEFEVENLYRDYLDTDGEISVAGIYFYPSVLLESADPVAFRCGFLDWVDYNEFDEWHPDHEWIDDEDDED